MLSHPPKHQASSKHPKKKKKKRNGEEALKQCDSLYVFFWINFLNIQTRGTVGRPAWGGGGKGRDREKEGIESGVLPSVSGRVGVRVKRVAGYWVGFSNFYFYSLISLI